MVIIASTLNTIALTICINSESVIVSKNQTSHPDACAFHYYHSIASILLCIKGTFTLEQGFFLHEMVIFLDVWINQLVKVQVKQDC